MRIARMTWTSPAVLTALVLAGCQSSEPKPEAKTVLLARANVLIVLIDTLRADALGLGGSSRPTSPNLDAWSEKGAVFDAATTPAGWTRTAVVSLFTGLYPASHGVQDKEHVAPDELTMLAEVLRDAGYATDAFVTNFAVHSKFGCGQGFERFRWFDKKVDSRPGTPAELNYVPIGDIDGEVRSFLAQDHQRPFFAYVHTTDPHFPYLPPAEHLLFGTGSRGRYDGEVHYTDAVIGSWLDLLAETGRLDDTLVVLTSDHGEEFGEHGGSGHGITVFEEIVRVPLVVWAPGIDPGRHSAQVSLVDLPRTILEAVGVAVPVGFARQSRSFWQIATTGGSETGWSWAYHELVYRTKGIAFAYREASRKIVHIAFDKLGRNNSTRFYDVVADPFEQQDLLPSRPDQAEQMKQRMASIRREHVALGVASVHEPLDDDAVERLRALGYID